jgi:hypothetical protein
MQTLQLYIDSNYDPNQVTYQRVDLFKDETVSLTQSIQNVRDLAKIFTDFTQTFTIPASKENNKLFRHYNNFNITNTFDARNRVPAKIELNNIPFKKGSVRLDGTELKNNKLHAYKITFFGETVNLKTLLEDDELQDLGALDDLNENYTDSLIRYYLVQNPSTNGTNGDLIVPLITHTDQLFYNSSGAAQGNGNVRWVNSSSANQVYWKQLKYALRLHRIITEIQAKYTTANGYPSSIVFSNDFFNPTNLAYYNLYMWLHRKKGDVEPAEQVSLQYKQLTNFPIFSSSSTLGQQTSVQNGAITVIGDLVTSPNNILAHTITFIPNQTNLYNIQVYRGSQLVAQKNDVQNQQTITQSDFPLTAGTYTIFIASSSTTTFNSGNIRWEIEGFLGGESPSGGPLGGYTDEYRSGSLFSTSTIFEFTITQQIPKMKIIDFLTALFKMFNLTAFVEDNGTIKVQTLDSFYASGKGVVVGTEAWALDEYIDKTKSQVNVALPFKEVGFQYKGLKTFLAVQYQQLDNREWGSNSYSLQQAKYTAPGDSYKVEIPFEHMQFERLFNASGGGATDIQWGWSVDQSRNATHGLPLIFYAIHQTSATSISFGFESGNKTQQTAYNIPSNSLAISSGSSKKNIHFITERNEFTRNFAFTENLFDQFYSTYINDVFAEQRRITKITAYLPLKIIYNLKMNDRVSIGSQEYIINSLKTNLTNGKSDIELLNVVS